MSLEQSREHWLALAADEDRMADFYDANGQPYGCTKVYRYRASLYRRTAESIQIEIDTGVPVCVCCFKPFGEGTRILISRQRTEASQS